ncbi:MAG: HD domain-containing protein [Phycisphaerales bacterium]|nr:HD domain-containing protein [Phycisphaerales bacterium]MCB9863392.1 HD domain-containing protein [Phycisphaerales bacterium]
MPDKIFRDPLYNYICIDKGVDRWLLDLINCPEVQRLRRIHQLGVSNLTYPGADHNRLAHSLGVVHLMQQVLENLKRKCDGEEVVKAARMRLLAAALLHDVGHGPFSHLFEPCLGIRHEEWSIAIVRDPTTEAHQVLAKEDPYLPDQVADLIEEKNPKPPIWQKALLSSQLDVDRIDYLRRDSLFSGAGYGHFDWFRLISSVEFHGPDKDLVWPEKSALAIEEYIFARFYMYQNVYLHKTTRGYEQLIQAMWNRANALRRNGIDVAPVPALKALWEAESASPNEFPVQSYLDFEEFTVLSQIQEWRTHADATLSDLARRFLVRDGLVVIDPPPPSDPLENDNTEWEQALKGVICEAGFTAPDYYCLGDTLKSKYRLPYRPEPEEENQTSVNSIRVLIPGEHAPREISDYLDRLKAVTALAADRIRYYVPKEVREAAMNLRAQWPSD